MPFKTEFLTTKISAVTLSMTTCCRSTRASSSSFLLTILLLLQVICNAQTVQDFFRENDDTSKPPADCYKSHKLSTFHLDDTDASYRLTVDLPTSVSRKTLNVDIDYDQGLIEIMGWWMEQKVRGERPKKACVYQEFWVDLASQQQNATTDWSLYDLVMELQGQQLALSLPKLAKIADEEGKGEENNISDFRKNTTTYVVAHNLWKMVRGLARLNSSLHNATLMIHDENDGVDMQLFAPSPNDRRQKRSNQSSYLRSKREALERFLRFSLGATDEESYWLKHM